MHAVAGLAQTFADDAGVFHVVVDVGLHGFAALGAEDRRGGTLHGVAHAVELGGVAAVPQAVQRYGRARSVAGAQLFGNDGERAAGAGEARGLGKAAEFNRHVARAWDLENAVHQAGLADERLVGGVEQYDGAFALGVFDPALERGARHDRAGRVVGRAEIDQVHVLVGQGRLEAVFGRRGQVDQLAVAAVFGGAGAAGHHVGVHVDGIDRVGHRDDVVDGEDLLHVGGVALRAVGHEDLVGRDLGALAAKMRRDRFDQEVVAAAAVVVAAEGFLVRHLVHAGLHRVDDGRGQRQHHVADAQANDARSRIRRREIAHALADFREQIAGLKLLVVRVDRRHGAQP